MRQRNFPFNVKCKIYIVAQNPGRRFTCPIDPKNEALCSFSTCTTSHGGKFEKRAPYKMQLNTEDFNCRIGKDILQSQRPNR